LNAICHDFRKKSLQIGLKPILHRVETPAVFFRASSTLLFSLVQYTTLALGNNVRWHQWNFKHFSYWV